MEAIEILRKQVLLGRTIGGWDIGEEAISFIHDSIAEVESGENSLQECSNCRFIANMVAFSSGCPNCGCKDFDVLPEGGAEIRKDQK